MNPAGLEHENSLAGEGQQLFVNDRPILSSERVLHKEYDRNISLRKYKFMAVSFKELVSKMN
jgi:hypothetical protein